MRIICAICWIGMSMSFLTLGTAQAQLPSGWRAHDLNRPAPEVVDPGASPAPASVPSDATVLFDGTNLDQWRDGNGNDAKWKVVEGAMESVAGGGYVYSKEKFGDCQLHVEWAAPVNVQGDSQGRGNSGVYLMGDYEVQVLDSFDNKTYADGSAGSIYGQYPPLVNACRKPGQWQCFDIIFRQPRFDDSGKLLSPARLTVLHNGVLIQDNSEVFGPTNWIQLDEYQPGVEEAPLGLQDHGNPVRYRNIWIRRLPPVRPRPVQPYASESKTIVLSDEKKQNLSGEYDGFSVENRDGVLFLNHLSRTLEMLPVSETRFEFRKSAGNIEFSTNESGAIVSAKIFLDAAGEKNGTKK